MPTIKSMLHKIHIQNVNNTLILNILVALCSWQQNIFVTPKQTYVNLKPLTHTE